MKYYHAFNLSYKYQVLKYCIKYILQKQFTLKQEDFTVNRNTAHSAIAENTYAKPKHSETMRADSKNIVLNVVKPDKKPGISHC